MEPIWPPGGFGSGLDVLPAAPGRQAGSAATDATDVGRTFNGFLMRLFLARRSLCMWVPPVARGPFTRFVIRSCQY